MARLSRDAVFSATDFTWEDVEVPEWGGIVRVRSLSGKERDEYVTQMYAQNSKGKVRANLTNLTARLVVLCCIDEQNNQLFEPEDVHALGRRNAAALARIFDVAQRLSGLTDEDVEELAEGFA